MSTFTIEDENINVESIMKKIRENISKRKKDGTYNQNELKIIDENFSAGFCAKKNISEDFEFMRECVIRNENYVISSHRPLMGKFLIKGRQMVHGEVRRYVDPMFSMQTEFNRSTDHSLNAFNERLTNLENQINDIVDQVRLEIDGKVNQLRPEMDDKIDQVRLEIDGKVDQLRPEMDDKIVNELDSLLSSVSSDLENKAWLAQILESKNRSASKRDSINNSLQNQDTGLNYFVFEDKFRGPREAIIEKQNVFLSYFEGCKNVLDIGCGRGEFLETMRENGIGAHGVDSDESMVEYCRSKGLEVEYGDALDYIQRLEDSSIDGIFIDQVVEHLEPNYLIKLLELCFQKMKYGFYIVAETVNPLSFSAFANFYIDLTHLKPVHPETLKFLLESTGFRELEITFSSPLSEEEQLKKIPIREEMSNAEKHQVETYNWNIERLNATLYGAQDYALIGKK